MALICSTITVSDAYANIKRQGLATKAYLQAQNAAMQQPTCSAYVPKSVIQHYVQVIALMDGWVAAAGGAALASYASTAEPTAPAGYDPSAEYTNMRNAMVSARDQIVSMFPKDAQSRLLYETFDASDNVVAITFTSAQLAPVVALNNSVIATIG